MELLKMAKDYEYDAAKLEQEPHPIPWLHRRNESLR